MADVYEKDLARKSSLTMNDFIRIVGSDNVSYKQLVSDVADKIIASRYLGYGVGSIASNDDLNTYRTAGVYACGTGSVAQTLSNCPTTSAFRLEVKQLINADRCVQEVYANSTALPTYVRTYTGSWGQWIQYANNAQTDLTFSSASDMDTKLANLPTSRPTTFFSGANDVLTIFGTGSSSVRGVVAKHSTAADFTLWTGVSPTRMFTFRMTLATHEITYQTEWPTRAEVDALKSDNVGYRATALIPNTKSSATVSFPSWHTMALVIVGRTDQFNAVYLYVNGYAVTEIFATVVKPTVSLSSDYLTMTISGMPTGGADKYIIVLSSSQKPTIAS